MSTYSIIRGQPIEMVEEMITPKREMIVPQYPNRRQTLLGLEVATPKTISDAVLSNLFPIRYSVMLATIKTGMLIQASVVTHCELEMWCDWHGYSLVSMEGNPELALPNERTKIG